MSRFWVTARMSSPSGVRRRIRSVRTRVAGADVAADGEEQAVPQAEDAEIAPDQVEGHREDREGGELAQGVDEIRRGRRHEEPGRGHEAEPDEAGHQGIAHGAPRRSGGGLSLIHI